MIRGLGYLVGVLMFGAATGCDKPARPAYGAPPPPPPVSCAEYPADRQDIVSCRSVSSGQGNEVWARSAQLAAASAIAQSCSYIQWLSVENRVETATGNSPFDCSMRFGGMHCTGGAYEVPVGLVTVTRFAFLSPEEAQARLTDPLIPAERRPIDARVIVRSGQR